MIAIERNLKQILDKLDVPEQRKIINQNNLCWLSRNLGIRNCNHPEFPSAIHFIQTLLKTTYSG